ncbi:hypothetical protein Anas_01594 [Armadillidium nasatum]|uniref:Uncharacterized protein n=1 Tax=Armadillidium nasatum TaxID=96803 RepID=A0A5N5T8F2_9CRUS|nr:hypothetical protein Anas_01594 [Armadillidium nasatum]
MFLEILVICCFIVGRCSSRSGYVVTTPFTWTSGVDSQICVSLTNANFSIEDALEYSLFDVLEKDVIQEEKTINFPIGND